VTSPDGKILTLNTKTWTNLELPLGGHDLGVGTGDLDTGVQASLVVSLDDISAEDLAGTDTAVVWTLWTWETIYWPAIWSVAHVKKGVLLLQTEPWVMGGMRLHELGGLVSVVELVWGSIGIPALSHDENIWGTTERIWEDGDGSDVDI
jgi:hypothetical protein